MTTLLHKKRKKNKEKEKKESLVHS